jgi:glucosamine kinase
MSKIAQVLAIDGGGTKTAAALLTAGGKEIARCRVGPANLYREPAAGLAEIARAWDLLCRQAGQQPEAAAATTAISAGLAGASGREQRRAFAAAFSLFVARFLSSDGYTAFLGIFGTAPGVLLSVGTGVVAYRREAGAAPEIRSGWGFPAADRGGGAWLGLRLATEYLDHLDGSAAIPDSKLWAVAAGNLGRERETILAWLSAAPAGAFAAMAPAVAAAAAADDALGATILAEGGQHLVRLARASIAATEARLCLGGGLAEVYRPRLEAELGTVLLPPTREPDPLGGAWLVATGQVPAEYLDVR